ncbi:hypothetical protein [Pseudomonas fluorescens]|uniref:Lipoprotein n=1 Tax=Pseudomonas fluorescens TaxID=294 RepID=A0A5E7AJC6_PSEFL|nr:hypothetical protein [Pseudomonas fluorescens]VVN76774.1 hypothetical protein PS691_00776 [Pseudomonas fluorescens]
MINISKWALTTLCAALLAGCGGSTDTAEKLADSLDMDGQYKMVVNMATAGYSTQYSHVPAASIKKVIQEHVSKDDLKDVFVESYASSFDDDELELIIKANKDPANAMAIIMNSEDGRALAQKAVKVQNSLMADMQKAFTDVDEDIQEELADLNNESRS